MLHLTKMTEDRHMTAKTGTRTGTETALAADSRESASAPDAALVERIREAVTFVARRNNARRALLFGSHARRTATRRSDVDLLFVEETKDRFLDRLDRYFDPLSDMIERPIEVLVYTPDEYKRMREDSAFVRCAEREGIVLYELREE
jgi:predicted nucleotidyltransferase